MSKGNCRDNLIIGKVVKEKEGNLDEDIWEGFRSSIRKEFAGVVEILCFTRRFLIMFKDKLGNDMVSNKLTDMK